MKKILVPTDFSKPAQTAVKIAVDIAKRANAEIILLNVVEQEIKDSFNAEAQVNGSGDWEDKLFTFKLIEKRKSELEVAVMGIQSEGIIVKQELRLGNPFHGITTVIAAHQVDLIVMGTAFHSSVQRLMIGSNTEKVIRHSKCPVLTVNEKSAISEFKDIAYATSMSEDEQAFSDVIRNVQEIYDATVHIVRINTPMNFRSDTEVKRMMENFARKSKLKKYTLNIFNHFNEEEGILHFAKSIQADLIGMATHGRVGLAHLLAGSIAEDVVSHSSRPVLTYVTK